MAVHQPITDWPTRKSSPKGQSTPAVLCRGWHKKIFAPAPVAMMLRYWPDVTWMIRHVTCFSTESLFSAI